MLKQHKKLVLAISGLLAAVLLLLAVLGTVSLVRSSRAVYSYRGQTVNTGEYAYLASIYKNQFMRECMSEGVIGVSDTEFFWNRRDEREDKTYGELYLAGLDSYVRSLLVTADLFDSTLGMTRARKKELSATLEAILNDRTGGDERAFDEATKTYGFTYRDLCEASVLVYKQAQLLAVVRSGVGDTVASMTEVCEEFLQTQYTRVKMIFIRTEDTFCYDDEGNRLTDEATGADMLRTLTEAERADRRTDIAQLTDAIARLNAGESGAITSVMFDLYQQKYERDGDDSYTDSGYYFAIGESFTTQMQDKFLDIVNNALQMESGEYRIVACDTGDFVGSCVLYCLTPETGAYADSATEAMFGGFYAGAAQFYMWQNIAEELSSVRQGRRFGDVEALGVARNYYYAVAF